MAAPLTYTYKVVPLPSPVSQNAHPANLASLAKRYSELRLAILLSAPSSFASSHAIESILTQEQWEQRVWRKGVTVFVCIARPVVTETAEVPEFGDFDGEWVGAATVFGPVPKADYQLVPEAGSPEAGADEEETKWQMTALFTSPEHRGKGLGKSLIKGAKDYAGIQTHRLLPTAKTFRLRIMAHPKNVMVVALYSQLGFMDVGRATGREAFVTNGDATLITAKMEGSEDVRNLLAQRTAIAMEYLETLKD
ncbi:hypothetical protein FIBSPDRAFT_787712 [Athelia psychrophila]|uniref:N-acetyltransferase domain-containing protein n=1 Tax=Athelia psychrophila TaxID=1759441 RepID=A0A166KH53_9AGAM|nr:hypothetical protein FIBSPDRAFT_787712 [Fibularhizoctonia sp. CBS 109695]